MDFMDEIDKKILTQLQDNCALTNHELATLVHISPATCMRRVKKLVQNGVIERQIAILSPEKLGAGLTAIVEISLDRQSAEALEDFERRVLNEPALQQCYRVSPGPDFVLILQVKDMADYHALAHRLFTAAANVRNVRSFFSLRRSKFSPRLAL